MELTTSYQKLGEAYLGNSSGNLYIRIYAKINSQSVENNTSNISYQSRLYFSGSYIISQGQTKVEMRGTNINNTTTNWQNFEGSQNGRFNNGETTVKTISTTIQHDSSGNASISASAIFSSAGSWGWSGTASGTATLPTLHKAPEISAFTISSENNAQLTTLGLATETIAQYLSNKTFTVTPVFYDDATISSCSIYHNNVLIGTSSTASVTVDFSSVSELQTVLSEGVNYAGFTVTLIDSKNGQSSSAFNFPVIKYTRPTIEIASTYIRRKTGGGVTLTQNLAQLDFVGTFYNGNDVIGNNNTALVQYKIWNDTEPSYTNLTTPQNANITIQQEIQSISYLKSWDYKIRISDSFVNVDASPYVTIGKVPTGVSLWTEYKDHVDFLNITKQHKEVYSNEYSTTEEIIVGKWINDKPIYRQVIEYTASAGESYIVLSNYISNLDTITTMYGTTIQPTTNNITTIPYYYNSSDYSMLFYMPSNGRLIIRCGSSYGAGDMRIVLEYTKTTD